MTPRIVTVPYRGLRCRELSCQAEIVMVATTRGRTMPLDRDPMAFAAQDERGLFVLVTGLGPSVIEKDVQALSLKAARENDLIVGADTPAKFRR